MIKALFNAQMLAEPEIVQTTIQSTGAVYSKSWDDFSNQELYNMLFSYTEGLIKHGMNKFGKELFQKAYEETIKELEQ